MRTQPGTKLIRRDPVGYPRYLCFACVDDFANPENLGRHILTAHPEYSPNDIVCVQVQIALRLPSALRA